MLTSSRWCGVGQHDPSAGKQADRIAEHVENQVIVDRAAVGNHDDAIDLFVLGRNRVRELHVEVVGSRGEGAGWVRVARACDDDEVGRACGGIHRARGRADRRVVDGVRRGRGADVCDIDFARHCILR